MKLYISCMAVFAIILCACNRASETKAEDIQMERVAADTTTFGAFAPQQSENENQNNQPNKKQKNEQQPDNNAQSNNNNDWNKKIIKTADVELELDDYKAFNSTLHSSLNGFGAYIAAEKQMQTDYRIENTVTIKVPVDQFDNLINSFAGKGIKINQKNISSEDVTGEMVDTKSRMQAKMAVRDKYMQLLKQAKNMNEILQVQNEINDIQEDIEAASGRVNYLQHASAYSTVKLSYYQYINGSSSSNETPDFFTKLSTAFATGAHVFANLVLFIISIWPLIIAALLVWFYIKRPKLKKA